MISESFEVIFWATATKLVDLIIPVIIILLVMALIKRFILNGS